MLTQYAIFSISIFIHFSISFLFHQAHAPRHAGRSLLGLGELTAARVHLLAGHHSRHRYGSEQPGPEGPDAKARGAA